MQQVRLIAACALVLMAGVGGLSQSSESAQSGSSDESAKLTAEVVQADPPKELSAAITAVLTKQAVRVREGKRELAMFWFRDVLPTLATVEQAKNGLTYRELEAGLLIGVVRFADGWVDFRKQSIEAGVYTLRLAFQPDDGDHMGTAPHTEFCLLASPMQDQKTDTIDFDTLHDWSSEVTQTGHPAVMLLFPNRHPPADVQIQSPMPKIETLARSQTVRVQSDKLTMGWALVVRGTRK